MVNEKLDIFLIHRVLDKLAGYRGNEVRAKAIVQMSEVLETSRYNSSNSENSHQWMDQNGWSFRKVFLQSNDGKIYEATLNIADGRDRRILYEINNVKLVDKKKTSASIPSTDESQRSSYQEHKMGRTQSEVTEESEDSTDGNTITLDSKEVKQLDSFDRKNPDIRYSISEREQDAVEERKNEQKTKHVELSRDTLPAKASKYLERTEMVLLNRIPYIKNICKRDPFTGGVVTGGIVTVKDSGWLLSWTINRQPQFRNQPKDQEHEGSSGTAAEAAQRVCPLSTGRADLQSVTQKTAGACQRRGRDLPL